MLRRCIETALDLNCGPVAVAIGRPNEPIRQNIAGTDVIVMEDAGVLNGQGAILKTGLTALLRHTPELRGVLITVCDQPLVDGKSLRHLINAPTGLAASAFLGTSGLPAWVSRCFFDELLALEDHGTLHSLLARHRNEVTAVSIPEAAIDIDTFAGLAALAP
jgi:molybdenum cofactor cytidylyltransferase